jgi:hypothetical protein
MSGEISRPSFGILISSFDGPMRICEYLVIVYKKKNDCPQISKVCYGAGRDEVES